MTDQRIKMEHLGYNDAWKELGIITDDLVEQQYDATLNSDDPYPEHYRARAFELFLSQRNSLSNDEFTGILGLADDGTDGCDLTGNRVVALLLSDLLNDEQIDVLSESRWSKGPPAGKILERVKARRKLSDPGSSYDVLKAILETTDDSYIHLYVLDNFEIKAQELLWLMQHGLNKAIRNRAKQMASTNKKQNNSMHTDAFSAGDL